MNWEEFCRIGQNFLWFGGEFYTWHCHTGEISPQDLKPNCVNCVCQRAKQIIESGGLIIQSIQNDSKRVWNNLHNKITFNNLSSLNALIDKLLINKKYCFTLLQEISGNFRHSDKSIEKSLDKIFNILN